MYCNDWQLENLQNQIGIRVTLLIQLISVSLPDKFCVASAHQAAILFSEETLELC